MVWEGVDWDAVVHGWGPVVSCCEHGNEPLGSIKCGKFALCG